MIEYKYLISSDDYKLMTADDPNLHIIVGKTITTRHRGGKRVGGYTADFRDVNGSVWINTRDDYGYAITNNDIVGQPEVNTYYVQIPGTSRVLDLSDFIGNGPTFAQRTLTFEFAYEDDPDLYLENYSSFVRAFHGHRIWIRLDQDPDYLYRGRVSCGQIKRTLSICKFTMTVTCDAMKYPYDEETGPSDEGGTL